MLICRASFFLFCLKNVPRVTLLMGGTCTYMYVHFTVQLPKPFACGVGYRDSTSSKAKLQLSVILGMGHMP